MKSTQKKKNIHGQRKKFASPNARDTNILVFFALGNAKVLSFALPNAKLPDASSSASQWNIGFTVPSKGICYPVGDLWRRFKKLTVPIH